MKYDLEVVSVCNSSWGDNKPNYRIDASVLAVAPFIENTNKTGQIGIGHFNCKRWHPSPKTQTKQNTLEAKLE